MEEVFTVSVPGNRVKPGMKFCDADGKYAIVTKVTGDRIMFDSCTFWPEGVLKEQNWYFVVTLEDILSGNWL